MQVLSNRSSFLSMRQAAKTHSAQKRALELVLRPFIYGTETVSLLLLCNVLSDIESDRNYDNDTLRDVLVVCVNTKVL